MLFEKGQKYRYLTEEKCQKIIDTVYRVLSEVGCEMCNEEARGLMEAAGCRVEGKRVYIPAAVLKDAIASVPKTVTIYDRFQNPSVTLEPGATYFGPHLGCPKIIDRETGEPREYREADAAETALVCDYLPNISWVAANGQLGDVDPRVADVHEARAVIANASKPITTWAITRDSLRDIIEMCEVAVGGAEIFKEKPNFFVGMCPMNCLTHGEKELDVFLYAAERGVPLLYTPGMMLGVQTPVTLAGGIVIGLCDTFVGLLLSQLKNRGMPFVSACFVDSVNMKTLGLTMTDPEVSMANLCCADVFRHIELPFVSHSTTSDANVVNQQAAAEAAIGIYNAILGGSNMVIHAGYLGGGLCSSQELLVLEDEIISMVRQIERGVEVDEDTLAFDVIQEIGPNGSYIDSDHTLDNYGSLWSPSVFDRSDYAAWVNCGKAPFYERLKDRVEEYIAKGPKTPLPEEALTKLDEIVARAEKRVLG